MHRRLSNFLEKNNILYGHEFGFRKNYSTSQAVLIKSINIVILKKLLSEFT